MGGGATAIRRVRFEFDGVFIGATWSVDMRNMMLVSPEVYVVAWQVATPFLGNHGLWLALFLITRGRRSRRGIR